MVFLPAGSRRWPCAVGMGLLSLLQWLLGCLCGWRRRTPHVDTLSGKPRYPQQQQQDEETSSEASSTSSGEGGSPSTHPTACRRASSLLSSDRWRRRPLLPTVGEGAGGSTAAASAPAAADSSSCRVDIERLERERHGGTEEHEESVRERGARRSRSAPMKLRGSLQQQLQQFESAQQSQSGDPDLGADMAALCRSASHTGGHTGCSARASRPRPRAALPGRWLQSSDVQQLAAELGLDLVADAEILWIAEEAATLSAAEPAGWSRERGIDLEGHEIAIFEHWASGEQLPEHPVRAYYKALVKRARADRRRDHHSELVSPVSASKAGGGSATPSQPSTLKVARASAVQNALEGELASAVRWLGWGDTSNVCEILLNAVRPRIPRALRAELQVNLGPPPHCAPRSDLTLGLTQDGRPLYCLSAFRHLGNVASSHVTGHYTVRLEQHDEGGGGGGSSSEESAFCGKLLCGLAQSDGSQFVFCDDPANFYGWPRELGAVVIRGGERGHVHVLLPRVTLSGAAAQFRVLRPQDGMLAKFRRGEDVQHMMSLQGHLMRHVTDPQPPVTPGGERRGDAGAQGESWTLQLFSETHGCVVFACRWRDLSLASTAGTPPATPTVRSARLGGSPQPQPPHPPPPSPSSDFGPGMDMSFAHPLSPYQAGCLALAISHHLQFEFPGRARAAVP